jgi:hypothetical protein
MVVESCSERVSTATGKRYAVVKLVRGKFACNIMVFEDAEVNALLDIVGAEIIAEGFISLTRGNTFLALSSYTVVTEM